MGRTTAVLCILAFAGLALVGRGVTAAKLEGEAGGAAVIGQVGSLRVIPQMALWQRVREAELAGDWHGVSALFDLLSAGNPGSAALAQYQATVEALQISPDMPDFESEWLWIERGLNRLANVKVAGSSQTVRFEGLWTIGFHAGQRHPARVSQFLAEVLGDEGLRVRAELLALELEQTPTAVAFLRTVGLSVSFEESEAGGRLLMWWETDLAEAMDQTTLGVLHRLDLVRWETLARIAKHGLDLQQGPRYRLLVEYVRSVSQIIRRTQGEDHSALLQEVQAAIEKERQRLDVEGTAEVINEFEAVVSAMMDAWSTRETED